MDLVVQNSRLECIGHCYWIAAIAIQLEAVDSESKDAWAVADVDDEPSWLMFVNFLEVVVADVVAGVAPTWSEIEGLPWLEELPDEAPVPKTPTKIAISVVGLQETAWVWVVEVDHCSKLAMASSLSLFDPWTPENTMI